MATKNYGMKVKVRFSRGSIHFANGVKTITYRNITEIHYRFIDGKSVGKPPTRRQEQFEELRGMKVAFESNIHSVGCTHLLSEIDEFETELETRKEKRF